MVKREWMQADWSGFQTRSVHVTTKKPSKPPDDGPSMVDLEMALVRGSLRKLRYPLESELPA